jgi:hypothetical protein
MSWFRCVSLFSLLFLAVISAGSVVADEGKDASMAFPSELIHFQPYEGNPVFQAGPAGAWDENIRERGWILYEEGIYHLWYTGYKTGDNELRLLGYAHSEDGIHWERHPDNPIHRDGWVEDMIVLKVGDTWYMFAEGEGDLTHLLLSKDRIHWEDQGALTILKTNGEAIEPGPFGTPVILYENDTWYFFYEREDIAIWLATSKDLKTWVHVQDEPVIDRGPHAYDLDMIALDQIIRHEDCYYAYFHGLYPGGKPREWCSAIAASRDLIHWEKYSGNPLIRDNKSSPIVVKTEDGYRLYTMHPAVHLFLPAGK